MIVAVNHESPRSDKAAILGVTSDLIGIFTVTFFVKKTVDDAIKDLSLPNDLNFYILAFWAVVASLLGGLLWAVVSKLTEKWSFTSGVSLGGSGREPHKLSAILWALVTILPLILTLIILNRKYSFIDFGQQLVIYGAFYVGCAFGSWCFYDCPISGARGIRNYIENRRQLSSRTAETCLGFVWPLLIAAPAFGLLWLAKTWAGISSPSPWTFLAQIGTVVTLTGLSVLAFVLTLPINRDFDSARGIVAGLFLRVGLFFGLLYA